MNESIKACVRIEWLLANPVDNAEAVVTWCVRTTGATLSDAARPLAIKGVRECKKMADLWDLAAKWEGVPGLESLATETRLVAAPHLEYIASQRVSSGRMTGKV